MVVDGGIKKKCYPNALICPTIIIWHNDIVLEMRYKRLKTAWLHLAFLDPVRLIRS